MNELISRIYEQQAVEDADGKRLNVFPVSVSYEQGKALYDAVVRSRAENTLEVGMAYGLSTLFICQAHRDKGGGRHVAMDPGQRSDYRGLGLLNVERAGLRDLLEFYELPSERALPKLLSEGRQFDLIFIDGMHLCDYVLVDFFFADRLLRTGGYLMLDDLWMPAVRKAVSFILRNRRYEVARELWGAPFPRGRQMRRLGRAVLDLAKRPLELAAARYSLWSVRHNYVVLKKTGVDARPNRHYRSF